MVKRQPWYRDKARLQAAVDQHGSIEAAARALDTPSSTVGHWARTFSIRSDHPKRPGVAVVTEQREAIGHTYLVGAEGSSLIKIGRTSGDPAARLRTMQTGSPVKLYLICTLPHPRWEDVLHHHFADKRRQGEWFELEPLDVAAIKRWANR